MIDVFSISGRGTVATGRVERGTITKGSEIEIVGMGPSFKTTLTGIEMFHKEVRIFTPLLINYQLLCNCFSHCRTNYGN